jgi:8-oxo-dGTP pyrophosphatase MutT (NUDIX family)
MSNIEYIKLQLTKRKPRRYWFTPSEQAAVALILREVPSKSTSTRESSSKNIENTQIEVLMMQRAVRAGDPWSGHMAFPGGKLEDSDNSLKSCAIREVYEEIGLHLKPHQCIGRLSDRMTRTHSNRGLMKVVPWVFTVPEVLQQSSSTLQFSLNHEAQSLHWIPLSLFNKENRKQLYWRVGRVAGKNINLRLPKYQFEDKIIWGLSLRMLDEFTKTISN